MSPLIYLPFMMPKDSGNNTSVQSSASRQMEHFIHARGCSVEGCHSGSIRDTALKFLQDILESRNRFATTKKIIF